MQWKLNIIIETEITVSRTRSTQTREVYKHQTVFSLCDSFKSLVTSNFKDSFMDNQRCTQYIL